MKKMIRLYIVIVSCLCFVACDMRELCYDHDSHAYKYQVNIVADYEQEWQYPLTPTKDWKENWPDTFDVRYSDLMPILPSGLRVMIYDSLRYDRQNIGRDGGLVYLTELEKSFIICNNNTEAVVFVDEKDKEKVSVTTRAIRRNSYGGSSYIQLKDVNTKTEPDVLYVNYIPSYVPISTIKPVDVSVLLKPVVYTYYIRYEFEYGIEHVVLARGALAGMSGSVNLQTQEPGNDLATVMYDAKKKSFGVDANVNSFGLPHDLTDLGMQLDGGEYACGLNLEVALTNGDIKTFEFDVTDQVVSQPRGGVIVVKGLRVEDEEAEGELEGGQVEVDDWGPYEDIIIDF
ncbi:MAG: DUF5119 domain-containing protein [Paludibacteraceae bacterium]|nr:DUF5119 domain-containing protein [Paludibacteraceae bacterium]